MPRLVVSLAERLLLHLLEMDAHREESEVPLDVSQEGMAARLGTQVHSVSRALSALESDGLVHDRLARVRGAPKRRRAYFLTDKGHKAASKAKESLLKARVVLEEHGKAEEMTLGQSMNRVLSATGSEPKFLDYVQHVRENEVIRPASVRIISRRAEKAERFVESAPGRPTVPSFFGRDEELKAITDHVHGETTCLLVWGIPGIGKTSMASKAFEGLSGKRHLFWHTVNRWDTEGRFISSLSEFLRSTGRRSTADEHARGGTAGSLFGPLVRDLKGLPAVIFLDDVHKAAEGMGRAISVLLEATRVSGSSKIVMMSRTMPPSFSKNADGNIAIELGALDPASARRLAESENAEDPAGAADASRGHPLLLTLMAKGGPLGSYGDMISFIETEVSMSLAMDERTVLDLLSVFRHPVPPEAVIDVDDDPLVRLKQKALLTEHERGLWTHDVLKEFFESRLGATTRADLHRRAAAYCQCRPAIDWQLESLYHHVQAGDHAAARGVALGSSDEFVEEFPEEALRLVMKIPLDGAQAAEDARLLLMRGRLREAVGDDTSASLDYERCLSLLPEDEGSAERAAALESLGKLKARVEEWTAAFSAHEKALRLYVKSDDRDGQIREWINIGAAHRRRGDLPKARDSYSEALSLASMKEDRSAQAACLNNLAMLDWDEGRLREAESRLKESVRLAHAVKDHAGEAKGLENLAELYRAQGRLSEMTNLLWESSEAFGRAGDLEDFKRLQASCAESLGAQGKVAEGVELCSSALSKPELRRKARLLQRSPRFDRGDAALSLALIGLYRDSGRLDDARAEVDRLCDISESLEDTVLHAQCKVELALVSESSGDLEVSADLLGEAERLLRAAGDNAGLAAVYMLLGTIDEKRGEREAAMARYKEAARHAEIVGDDHALKVATKNIEDLDASGK